MAYCSSCKMPLDSPRIIGRNMAWCPACETSVILSAFQVPSWTVGVLVVLTAFWRFCL